MSSIKNYIGLLLCSLTFYGFSQELEPRAITNLPVGTNFLVAAYAYTYGDILLDPALPIEGFETKLHTSVFGYVRSINFFGLSAKIDALIPIVNGDWQGVIEGSAEQVKLDGIGDLRVRFSFNFLNSHAMSPSEFVNYKPNNISGFSIQVTVPTGQYSPDEFVNLGSNRWVFKPQWGFSKNLNKWIIETYLSLWLFTKNNDYLDGNVLKQKSLLAAKVHVIRKLPKNMWVSANIGYGIGGKVYVNNIPRDSQISAARFGLHYAIPFGSNHNVKLGFVSGVRFEKGSDFDAFTISYQYRWNKSVKKYLKNKTNNN